MDGEYLEICHYFTVVIDLAVAKSRQLEVAQIDSQVFCPRIV